MKIAIYILLLSNSLMSNSCHNNKKVILKVEVKGIITNIYQDKQNHQVYTFNVRANSWYDGTFIADFYPGSWEYASIGDSIIKNKGETFVTIKKADKFFRIFETRVK